MAMWKDRCVRRYLSLGWPMILLVTRVSMQSQVDALHLPSVINSHSSTSRREVLKQSSLVSGALISATKAEVALGEETSLGEGAFQAYQVLPDASEALNPQLRELKSASFLDSLASSKGGAVWLGEHHNSSPDHILQAKLLENLRARRGQTPLAIGLEQVQIQFQPILDDYVAGKISMADMRRLVEWDKRWTWPFEVYEPIFQTAKDLQVSLVALNVNYEDLEFVERLGLPGLPPDRMREYIGDPAGFAAFARPQQYTTYVNYVITPSYQLHQDMGLLKTTMSGVKLDETMSFRNFLSGRMLWDESMAWNAFKWTKNNPGGLLVGLVGADHVKFRHGIPGRFARLADGQRDCVSVLLNPTLIDSRPSNMLATAPDDITSKRPDQITLQLRFVEDSRVGVLPLADYLVLG